MGQHNLEEIKKIILILVSIIITALLGFFLLKSTSTNSNTTTSSVEHNVFTYKEDGVLSIYNTKEKKYLDSLKISSKSDSLDERGYKNFFNIEDFGDKKVVASPSTNELFIISNEDNKIIKEKAITVNGIVENFRVSDSKAFIQYSDSNFIEIFSLDTKSLEDRLEFEEKTTNIEVDEDNLYIGTGDFIEIVPRDTLETNKTKIHIGSQATSIKKSENGFLYVGTDFGSDLNTSVLVKVDIKNKNIDNILSLNKEYPVEILEKGDYIYVLCKGITDTLLDGISIINKQTMEKYKSISTGNTPNSMFFTDDGYIYTSHDDGTVVAINAKKDFNIEHSFTINGVKEISLALNTKEKE